METQKQTAAGAEGVTNAERSGLLGTAPHNKESGGGSANTKRRRRDEGKGKGEASGESGRKRHPAVRALLWTLRRSIVPGLFLIALIGGLYVGFAVLGKRPGEGVFNWQTWKHMYDLVFADS
jgi:hypothetical protein